MNKIIVILFLVFFFPVFANAYVECRYGRFLPNDDIFYELYGKLNSYQLEGSHFYNKHGAFFGNLSFTYGEGSSIPLNDKSNFYNIALNLGLKCIPVNIKKFSIHLGIGAQPSYFITRDHSIYVDQHQSKFSVGAIFKQETFIKITKIFNLSFFSDYQIIKFEFAEGNSTDPVVEKININFSGWTLGIGISNSF